MRWVAMAGSEVRMMQPYGLVVEIHKLAEEGEHRIKVTYDPRAFSKQGARNCGAGIWEILGDMVRQGLDVDVEEHL